MLILVRRLVFAEAKRTSSTVLDVPETVMVTTSLVSVSSVFNCAAVAVIPVEWLTVITPAVFVFKVLSAAISVESRASVIVIAIKSPSEEEVPKLEKSARAPLSVA